MSDTQKKADRLLCDAALLMGALVTTFYVQDPSNHQGYCGLLRWCRTAHWAAQNIVPGLDVVVFTNDEAIGRRECPNARILPFDPELVRAVQHWDMRRQSGFGGPTTVKSWCPSKTLLKWMVVNPRHYPKAIKNGVVMYLDSDVDAGWHTSVEALKRLDFAGKLQEFSRDEECRLRVSRPRTRPLAVLRRMVGERDTT